MSAGNPPRALTGREAQKQQFRTMLGRLGRGMNEPSMIVFGLRGVGKTVLLLEFESIADASGWTAPDPIEIRSDTNFSAELADAAYQALLRLDRRRALGDRLKTFTRLLSGFKVGASIEGSVEFSFDPSAVGGSTGNLERDLTNLFVELGETAREHETGVVFLIDEMQFLRREEMEAIAAAMHRMSQKQLPIALAGAGLPQLPGLMVDAKSYAERLFSYPEIGPLSPDAARQALFEPAQRRVSALRMTRFSESLSLGLLRRVRSGIRQGDVEHGAGLADHPCRRAGRRAGRAGQARRGVLPCPLREGHARRATLHGRNGGPRRWPLQNGGRRRAPRRSGKLILRAPRQPHQEGPDLQPRPRRGQFHRPTLLPVHRRRYPL